MENNMKLEVPVNTIKEIMSLLKACAKKKDAHEGIRLHGHIAQRGILLEKSPYLVSALISMYAKCGILAKAHHVLDELLNRNVVSWNALITGYAQQGPYNEALNCFERMRNESLSPDAVTLTCVLNACGKLQGTQKGERIHIEILTGFLLENDIVLGNALIDMYAKCGMLARAEQVLKGMRFRDVVSWSALISGYAQLGQGYEALNCFEQMKSDGISPNAVTFIYILKACGNIRDMAKGKGIHADIVSCSDLFETDTVLGNALLDMYVKCGELAKAQKVLEELPVRDVVSWSILIEGYAQDGQNLEAVRCFELMRSEGLCPDSITLTSLSKACGNQHKGKQIHDGTLSINISEKNCDRDGALEDLYANDDILGKLQQTVEEIQYAYSWNASFSGYANQQGQCYKALNSVKWMDGYGRNSSEIRHCESQRRSLAVSKENHNNEIIIENYKEMFTLVTSLKACANEKDLYKGTILHADILYRGLLQRSPYLAATLITMYCKCGMLMKAHRVLKELPVQNIVSWNALISGYVQDGQSDNAMSCFEQMVNEGLSPDPVTFICILKACGRMRAIDKGKQIHNEIVNRGLLEKDIVLGNALIDMYAKCGTLEKAKQVLDELPEQDVVSWSTLIGGYAQQGQGHEALGCFVQMESRGIFPNDVTFISILMACGSTSSIEKGRKIHDEIVNRGLLEKNAALGTALMDMYAKCGMVSEARRVLQELPIRNEFTWSALISAYAHEGQGDEALECFEHMQNEGLSPDVATFVCLLNACSSSRRSIEKGEQIHGEIVSRGLLGKDVMLGNAFIDMYVKCGMLAKAQEVVEYLPFRDIVSWNTLMSGYAQQSQGYEAWNCFMRMQRDGISPDSITFMCLLKACGSAGAIEKGKQVHDEIVNRGLLDKNIELCNALVDMYAKCGVLAKAQEVLEELPVQNIVSWNTVIGGYAQQGGQGHEALHCLKRLQRKGLCPNAMTFLCLLSACCRSGLLDKARELYAKMTPEYGITPDIEHHTCMVVAFGLVGRFDEAMSMIKVMPSNYLEVWLSLLGTCKKWENVKLGRLAFDQALQLDSGCAAAYILMASIFEAAGMQDNAEHVKAKGRKYTSWEVEGNSVG